MKNKVKSKGNILLFILAMFLIFSLYIIENNKKIVKDNNYENKYNASLRTKKAFELIKLRKVDLEISIPIEDINKTGLIGDNYNEITTTLGSIESKRTSTNPNIAALMIELLLEANLKKGDTVGLNLSSSFPAINIAMIIACEELEIEPIIITSIGSSTWGGNNIDFTYIDMEKYLYDNKIISHKSIALSLGGSGDIGSDMDKDIIENILTRMKNYGTIEIIEEDLKKNVELRYKIYNKENRIDGFINIGGNLLSFGDTFDSEEITPGVLLEKKFSINDNTGLVQKFNIENIPVIHILNINSLAYKYGLRIDPERIPEIGEENIYYKYEYSKILIIISIFISFIFLFIYKRRFKDEI